MSEEFVEAQNLNSSFLYIGHGVIDPDICEEFIKMWELAEYTEITYPVESNKNIVECVNEEENDRLKYVDHMNRDIYSIGESNPHFEMVEEVIRPLLPLTHDLDEITYMSIIGYPANTAMPMHQDDADSADTATLVVPLNDDFRGGDFIIDDHVIKPYTGSMIVFNNCVNRFHGVNPVIMGERFSLCVWFTNPEQQAEHGGTEMPTGYVSMDEDSDRLPETNEDRIARLEEDSTTEQEGRKKFNNVIIND